MLRTAFISAVIFSGIAFIGLWFFMPNPKSGPIDPAQEKSTERDEDRKKEILDPETDQSILIENASIFLDGKIKSGFGIRLKSGVIDRLGKGISANSGDRIVDATDMLVIPGLIDAHTHSYGDAFREAIRFGVTTQVDMFSAVAILENTRTRREDLNNTTLTDLYSAGMLATVDGGHGTQFGVPVDTLSSSSDIEAWVDQRLAEGSDFIKLVYIPELNMFPSLDRSTAKAVIDAGHARGVKVVAHISSRRGAEDMVEDGIDGLVHIFADKPVTTELAEKIASNDVFVIPTLAVLAAASNLPLGKQFADNPKATPYLSTVQVQNMGRTFGQAFPGFDLELGLQNTKSLFDAGVRILAGSDAPNPGTAFGISIHQEMALLKRAGLSEESVLAAATENVALVFGLKDRGYIKEGSRADLVFLSYDEGNDIDTLNIGAIYKNGTMVERAILVNEDAAAYMETDLGTFDDNLTTGQGLTWLVTTDEFANGKSTASIEHIEPGRDGTGGAMLVKANVNPGFFFPWAGAFLMVSPDFVTGRSIADRETFSFDVRGTPGDYQVFMFNASAAGTPPTLRFKVTENWNRITMSIDDFEGLVPDNFAGLAISAGPATGTFIYELDNIRLE